MKTRFIIIVCLLFVSYTVSGQIFNDSVINEICISVNKTTLINNNSQSRTGFGIGIYHCRPLIKKFNLAVGFEYNRTNQFENYSRTGLYAWSENMYYHLDNLSVPLCIRYNIEREVKLFIETGVFADLNINSRRSGVKNIYYPDDNNELQYFPFEIDENAGPFNVNYGISFGAGVKLPLNKYFLIIKPDFKYGLTELHNYDDYLRNRYVRLLIGLSFF